jgi:perosamine synthetase
MLKKPKKPITFFNTFIEKDAYRNVKKTLDSTMLSEGKLVKEFEDKLASELGLINPVAVNSGTSALHLAIILAGIKAGDEVILPAQTFIATGLVIAQEGAVPVFADVQYETGNIDPKSIEKKLTKKTKAIMVVHWGGYPADMDEINKIAKKHKLIVIEDAAHALGATYKGRAIGSLSPFTCFSFQAIKHLTTGDGGAICIRDFKKLSEGLTKRWFGIDRANSKQTELGEREYDVGSVGYKYHLNDYSASLGLSNLKNFKSRLKRRGEIAKKYRKELQNIPGIKLFLEKNDRQSAHWLFGFHIERRLEFIRSLKEAGIPASVVHLGIDHNSLFGGKQKNLTNQRKFDDTQIHIPIHDSLDREQIDYIIGTIKYLGKTGW